jgi:hypothetical protein
MQSVLSCKSFPLTRKTHRALSLSPHPLAVAEAGNYPHGQEEESLPPRWDSGAI